MHKYKPASLVLEDGTEFSGYIFGNDQAVSGEVVFSTSMVGYPESLTDPSYCGKILCVTYPIIGNYGVPQDIVSRNLSSHFESEKIQVNALVVSDYSSFYSHWSASKSLDQWLKENSVPAIFGIDTRELTKIIRERGAMRGWLLPEGSSIDQGVISNEDKPVLTYSEPILYGSGDKRVMIIDCGVRHSIIRGFIERGIEVLRVPYHYNIADSEYDGIFISSGAGDPSYYTAAIEVIKGALQGDKPVFGISMGSLLMAKATGASLFKHKYGHRGNNQPVRVVGSNRCFITSQNHDYLIDESTLNSDWSSYFVNINDGTNEGIRHNRKPFFSCQFHTLPLGGSSDTAFLFDDFIKSL